MRDRFRNLSRPLRLVAGLFILTVVISQLDWLTMVGVISTIDVWPLTLGIGMLLPLLLLKCWRWYLLLGLQEAQYAFSSVVIDFLSGNYVGLVTPGRVGELARVIYQRQASGISYGKALSNVMVDRFLDLGITLSMTGLGIVVYRPMLPFGFALGIGILLGVGLLSAITMVVVGSSRMNFQLRECIFGPRLSGLYRRLTDDTSGLSTFLTDFYVGLTQFRQSKIMFPLLISVLAFFWMIWQNSLLARSLHIDLSIPYLAFCITTTNLVSLLPISISGIGTRDAVFVFLLTSAGVSPERAFGFSLLFLFTFNLTGVVLGALAWYLRLI